MERATWVRVLILAVLAADAFLLMLATVRILPAAMGPPDPGFFGDGRVYARLMLTADAVAWVVLLSSWAAAFSLRWLRYATASLLGGAIVAWWASVGLVETPGHPISQVAALVSLVLAVIAVGFARGHPEARIEAVE